MHSKPKVAFPEKTVAVLSYITFGIVGFFWLILANWKKRKIKYFLSYHIYQSIFISVLLTLLNYIFVILFGIFSKIPFLEMFSAIINYLFTVKIISVFGFQSTVVYLAIVILESYLIIGVLLGRNFYLPFVTKTVNYMMDRMYE